MAANLQPICLFNTDKGKPSNGNRFNDSSPFNEYWLLNSSAYLTPDPAGSAGDARYKSELAKLTAGHLVAAYENGAGIVAIGRVLGPPNASDDRDEPGLYDPLVEPRVLRCSVDWDLSVHLPYAALKAIGIIPNAAIRVITGSQLKDLHDLISVELGSSACSNATSASEDLSPLMSGTDDARKDRDALIRIRIGQERFRKAVLKVEQRCRVTGCDNPLFLRASHIHPWSECKGLEHLDGYNGLMLAPHVDHLFDRHLITFDDKGALLVSKRLKFADIRDWNIQPILPMPFTVQQKRYMALHRARVKGNLDVRKGAADSDLLSWDDWGVSQ